MINIVKKVRQLDTIMKIQGIDENKQILLERNTNNQILLKYQGVTNKPNYIKQRDQIEFTDTNKLEAMMMMQIGF